MTDIISAIKAIKADAHVTVNGETVEGIIWHDDNPTNITNQQILDKQVELQADYDAKQYQRDRAAEYPELGEQLDKLYHDINNGTLTTSGGFFTALDAVKTKYPKE